MLAYEFVEAFSSVVPSVRISQILAVLGIIVDVLWRITSRNFSHPSFVDIVAALLVGYYFGKRPKVPKAERDKKSKWIRLS
jgi:membrane associated rhomboid family serine protease